MAISVAEPIGPALERTKAILFRPFDFNKWCLLGFCAWLTQLTQSGYHFNFQFPFPGRGSSGGTGTGGITAGGFEATLNAAKDWVMAHLALVITLGIVFIVVMTILATVMVWVSCRGNFMFIDGVVRNRGAVSEPWREYRREGNSLFWFRLWFSAAGFTALAIVAGFGVAVAWPDIQAEQFGWNAGCALVLGIPVLIFAGVIFGCLSVFLDDFVIPIMYLRRLTWLPAWHCFLHTMLAGRFWLFVLYLLFRMVIGLVMGILILVLVLCTCCILAIPLLIPYVSTVLLLPFAVFIRAYTLYFIEQFGPEWRFFPMRPASV